MPPRPPETDATPAASGESLDLARRIVVSCRRRLDWMMMLPDLESLLEEAVAELELRGRRQGIGLRAALEALPIEHKFMVLRWVLPHFKKLFATQWAAKLASDWGIALPPIDTLEAHLSATQWETFRDDLASALGREQRRYKQAQATLFHQHRHLVRMTVARIVYSHSRQDDAVQEGSLAMLAAIDRIDSGSGSFEAYAQQWIARAVRNFLLRERLPVHAPVNLVSQALCGGGGAGALHQAMLERPVELDAADSILEIADAAAVKPDVEAARTDARETIKVGLARLTPKQREVVELRYGLHDGGAPMTIQEIARRVGITHQQVSMREKRAIEALATLLAPLAAELA
jgi:RNA polymerase sigma factor (sigma-70 family)